MDREQLDRLAQLSDDEFNRLVDLASNPEGDKQTVQVTLSDGTVIKADSQEELNEKLAARLEAVPPAPVADDLDDDEPQQPGKPPKGKKFKFKKFEQLFIKDPIAGLDYADESRFGAPLKTILPTLAQVIGAQNAKIQELEAQAFLDTTDYEPSVENMRTLNKIMSERGWAVSRQSLKDAYAIALNEGLIGSDGRDQEEVEVEEPFVAPRTARRAEPEGDDTSSDELLERLRGLPDDAIFKLGRETGLFRS